MSTSTQRDCPFTPGVVVPPERFFGRAEIIDSIYRRVSVQTSVSIVGEARIGKTSLLRYLEARLPTTLLDYGRYLVVYVSMDMYATRTELYSTLVGDLTAALPPGTAPQASLARYRQLADTDSASRADVDALLELAQDAGCRVVVLLDEFRELLDHSTEFDDSFRGWLRSCYSHGRLTLVLATRQPLVEIRGIAEYFANAVVAKHQLGRLDDPSARQLLSQPSDRPLSAEAVQIGVRRRRPSTHAAERWLLSVPREDRLRAAVVRG